MDLYSEELPIDVINGDIDGNQVACEKSDENTSILEKQASNSNAEVASNSLLTLPEGNHKVTAQRSENEKQALQGQCDMIIESEFENKEATEISTKSQESEKINPEENSESRNDVQITSTTVEDSVNQTNDNHESNGKKRRGRRSQKELSDLKPTRESTRKRKCPLVFDYNDASMKKRYAWTSEEKQQLLTGLEKFGMDDVKSIHSYVPSKPESSISNQIRICRELGRNKLENTLFSQGRNDKSNAFLNSVLRLSEWGEYFEELAKKSPQRLYALSNVFILISEYGKFPKPSECKGIDLRAMYRYLHCMMNGKPYYGMNGRTADILLQCLTNVLRHLQTKPQPEQLISNLLQESLKKPMKTYSRAHVKKLSNSTLEKPDGFLNLPGINPLNIPASVLLKPEEDQEEESEYEVDDTSVCDNDDDSSDFDSD